MNRYHSDIFCTYDALIDDDEPFPEPLRPFDSVSERGAVAYHEAGHAVLDHALGFGIERVSVGTTTRADGGGRAFHGVSQTTKASSARIKRRLNAGRFHSDLLSYGIVLAAGAAAERKYRLRYNLPQRIRFGASEDKEAIYYVTRQLTKNGQNEWAFPQLVWRRAQLALEHPMIWSAVSALAEHLWQNWPDDEDVGEHNYTCPEARARLIILAEGVRRLMKLPRTMAELVGSTEQSLRRAPALTC
jgi:hypothetical protein